VHRFLGAGIKVKRATGGDELPMFDNIKVAVVKVTYLLTGICRFTFWHPGELNQIPNHKQMKRLWRTCWKSGS
jgi:hypothetical protein